MTIAKDFHSSFFQLRQSGDVAVLSLTRPRLTEEENLEQLDRDFNTLTDTFHIRRIVVDLTPVSYLTSAAIAKLISLHRRLARSEGQLVLCSLHPQVAETLQTAHLLDYFSVTPNTDSALASFN